VERHSEIPWRVDLSLITGAGIRLSEPAPAVPLLPDAGVRGTDRPGADQPDLDILVVTTVAIVTPAGQEPEPGSGGCGIRTGSPTSSRQPPAPASCCRTPSTALSGNFWNLNRLGSTSRRALSSS